MLFLLAVVRMYMYDNISCNATSLGRYRPCRTAWLNVMETLPSSGNFAAFFATWYIFDTASPIPPAGLQTRWW